MEKDSGDKTMEMDPHQIDAYIRMKNGCVLNGGVGSGKSRTALAYYYFKIADGTVSVNGEGMYRKPKNKVPLYIITTAAKRDKKDWESEMIPFLLSPDVVPIVVDSWNNIQKYTEVNNAFFIFDEQRVVGSGKWSKSFIKIAKKNRWILLSATPGDKWLDYVPLFIANGFYKNRTDFINQHVVYNKFTTYPSVSRYLNEKKLEHERDMILIPMEVSRQTVANDIYVTCNYDRQLYKSTMLNRWDPFKNEPIQQISGLCYTLRKITNTNPARIKAVDKIVNEHPKCIIFYNFDYELEMLVEYAKAIDISYAQWNGHKHEKIPTDGRWLYLVQYTAGAEGWNCIETDTIIFYSQNYSYKIMVQSAGRIDRMNTPFINLYYYHLKSNAPIDLAIHRALVNKKSFNESRYFKKREK